MYQRPPVVALLVDAAHDVGAKRRRAAVARGVKRQARHRNPPRLGVVGALREELHRRQRRVVRAAAADHQRLGRGPAVAAGVQGADAARL